MKMDIVIKGCPDEAKTLVELWLSHSSLIDDGLEFITFVDKTPKDYDSDIRVYEGLEGKIVSYLDEGKELVKMSVENFIYLMVKCGVIIDIIELDSDIKQ